MVNIALCITDLNAGGAERCLVEIARRVDRSLFSPVVYCLKPPPEPGESSLVPLLESAGVEVHFLNARSIANFPGVVSRLWQMLRERDTRIAQSFLFHANLAARLACRNTDRCRVLSGVRVAERGTAWHRWLDRATHRLADKYICVSEAVATFSADVTKIPREKLAVIPNGIDLAQYCDVPPAEFPQIRPGRRLVTCVGRLEAQKSVRQLIDNARNWLQRLPDCDLLLVGKGPEEAELRRQCQNAGIAARVHFLGWRADIPAILAASELLVLTSAWEGMPNVVLEAMASGLPVAVTRVEGVEELLGPAAAKQSVAYGDWAAFSDTVVRILEDRDLAESLGQANRRRAAAEFEIERAVKAYQTVWQALLSG